MALTAVDIGAIINALRLEDEEKRQLLYRKQQLHPTVTFFTTFTGGTFTQAEETYAGAEFTDIITSTFKEQRRLAGKSTLQHDISFDDSRGLKGNPQIIIDVATNTKTQSVDILLYQDKKLTAPVPTHADWVNFFTVNVLAIAALNSAFAAFQPPKNTFTIHPIDEGHSISFKAISATGDVEELNATEIAALAPILAEQIRSFTLGFNNELAKSAPCIYKHPDNDDLLKKAIEESKSKLATAPIKTPNKKGILENLITKIKSVVSTAPTEEVMSDQYDKTNLSQIKKFPEIVARTAEDKRTKLLQRTLNKAKRGAHAVQDMALAGGLHIHQTQRQKNHFERELEIEQESLIDLIHNQESQWEALYETQTKEQDERQQFLEKEFATEMNQLTQRQAADLKTLKTTNAQALKDHIATDPLYALTETRVQETALTTAHAQLETDMLAAQHQELVQKYHQSAVHIPDVLDFLLNTQETQQQNLMRKHTEESDHFVAHQVELNAERVQDQATLQNKQQDQLEQKIIRLDAKLPPTLQTFQDKEYIALYKYHQTIEHVLDRNELGFQNGFNENIFPLQQSVQFLTKLRDLSVARRQAIFNVLDEVHNKIGDLDAKLRDLRVKLMHTTDLNKIQAFQAQISEIEAHLQQVNLQQQHLNRQLNYLQNKIGQFDDEITRANNILIPRNEQYATGIAQIGETRTAIRAEVAADNTRLNNFHQERKTIKKNHSVELKIYLDTHQNEQDDLTIAHKKLNRDIEKEISNLDELIMANPATSQDSPSQELHALQISHLISTQQQALNSHLQELDKLALLQFQNNDQQHLLDAQINELTTARIHQANTIAQLTDNEVRNIMNTNMDVQVNLLLDTLRNKKSSLENDATSLAVKVGKVTLDVSALKKDFFDEITESIEIQKDQRRLYLEHLQESIDKFDPTHASLDGLQDKQKLQIQKQQKTRQFDLDKRVVELQRIQSEKINPLQQNLEMMTHRETLATARLQKLRLNQNQRSTNAFEATILQKQLQKIAADKQNLIYALDAANTEQFDSSQTLNNDKIIHLKKMNDEDVFLKLIQKQQTDLQTFANIRFKALQNTQEKVLSIITSYSPTHSIETLKKEIIEIEKQINAIPPRKPSEPISKNLHKLQSENLIKNQKIEITIPQYELNLLLVENANCVELEEALESHRDLLTEKSSLDRPYPYPYDSDITQILENGDREQVDFQIKWINEQLKKVRDKSVILQTKVANKQAAVGQIKDKHLLEQQNLINTQNIERDNNLKTLHANNEKLEQNVKANVYVNLDTREYLQSSKIDELQQSHQYQQVDSIEISQHVIKQKINLLNKDLYLITILREKTKQDISSLATSIPQDTSLPLELLLALEQEKNLDELNQLSTLDTIITDLNAEIETLNRLIINLNPIENQHDNQKLIENNILKKLYQDFKTLTAQQDNSFLMLQDTQENDMILFKNNHNNTMGDLRNEINTISERIAVTISQNTLSTSLKDVHDLKLQQYMKEQEAAMNPLIHERDILIQLQRNNQAQQNLLIGQISHLKYLLNLSEQNKNPLLSTAPGAEAIIKEASRENYNFQIKLLNDKINTLQGEFNLLPPQIDAKNIEIEHLDAIQIIALTTFTNQLEAERTHHLTQIQSEIDRLNQIQPLTLNLLQEKQNLILKQAHLSQQYDLDKEEIARKAGKENIGTLPARRENLNFKQSNETAHLNQLHQKHQNLYNYLNTEFEKILVFQENARSNIKNQTDIENNLLRDKIKTVEDQITYLNQNTLQDNTSSLEWQVLQLNLLMLNHENTINELLSDQENISSHQDHINVQLNFLKEKLSTITIHIEAQTEKTLNQNNQEQLQFQKNVLIEKIEVLETELATMPAQLAVEVAKISALKINQSNAIQGFKDKQLSDNNQHLIYLQQQIDDLSQRKPLTLKILHTKQKRILTKIHQAETYLLDREEIELLSNHQSTTALQKRRAALNIAQEEQLNNLENLQVLNESNFQKTTVNISDAQEDLNANIVKKEEELENSKNILDSKMDDLSTRINAAKSNLPNRNDSNWADRQNSLNSLEIEYLKLSQEKDMGAFKEKMDILSLRMNSYLELKATLDEILLFAFQNQNTTALSGSDAINKILKDTKQEQFQIYNEFLTKEIISITNNLVKIQDEINLLSPRIHSLKNSHQYDLDLLLKNQQYQTTSMMNVGVKIAQIIRSIPDKDQTSAQEKADYIKRSSDLLKEILKNATPEGFNNPEYQDVFKHLRHILDLKSPSLKDIKECIVLAENAMQVHILASVPPPPTEAPPPPPVDSVTPPPIQTYQSGYENKTEENRAIQNLSSSSKNSDPIQTPAEELKNYDPKKAAREAAVSLSRPDQSVTDDNEYTEFEDIQVYPSANNDLLEQKMQELYGTQAPILSPTNTDISNTNPETKQSDVNTIPVSWNEEQYQQVLASQKNVLPSINETNTRYIQHIQAQIKKLEIQLMQTIDQNKMARIEKQIETLNTKIEEYNENLEWNKPNDPNNLVAVKPNQNLNSNVTPEPAINPIKNSLSSIKELLSKISSIKNKPTSAEITNTENAALEVKALLESLKDVKISPENALIREIAFNFIKIEKFLGARQAITYLNLLSTIVPKLLKNDLTLNEIAENEKIYQDSFLRSFIRIAQSLSINVNTKTKDKTIQQTINEYKEDVEENLLHLTKANRLLTIFKEIETPSLATKMKPSDLYNIASGEDSSSFPLREKNIFNRAMVAANIGNTPPSEFEKQKPDSLMKIYIVLWNHIAEFEAEKGDLTSTNNPFQDVKEILNKIEKAGPQIGLIEDLIVKAVKTCNEYNINRPSLTQERKQLIENHMTTMNKTTVSEKGKSNFYKIHNKKPSNKNTTNNNINLHQAPTAVGNNASSSELPVTKKSNFNIPKQVLGRIENNKALVKEIKKAFSNRLKKDIYASTKLDTLPILKSDPVLKKLYESKIDLSSVRKNYNEQEIATQGLAAYMISTIYPGQEAFSNTLGCMYIILRNGIMKEMDSALASWDQSLFSALSGIGTAATANNIHQENVVLHIFNTLTSYINTLKNTKELKLFLFMIKNLDPTGLSPRIVDATNDILLTVTQKLAGLPPSSQEGDIKTRLEETVIKILSDLTVDNYEFSMNLLQGLQNLIVNEITPAHRDIQKESMAFSCAITLLNIQNSNIEGLEEISSQYIQLTKKSFPRFKTEAHANMESSVIQRVREIKPDSEYKENIESYLSTASALDHLKMFFNNIENIDNVRSQITTGIKKQLAVLNKKDNQTIGLNSSERKIKNQAHTILTIMLSEINDTSQLVKIYVLLCKYLSESSVDARTVSLLNSIHTKSDINDIKNTILSIANSLILPTSIIKISEKEKITLNNLISPIETADQKKNIAIPSRENVEKIIQAYIVWKIANSNYLKEKLTDQSNGKPSESSKFENIQSLKQEYHDLLHKTNLPEEDLISGTTNQHILTAQDKVDIGKAIGGKNYFWKHPTTLNNDNTSSSGNSNNMIKNK